LLKRWLKERIRSSRQLWFRICQIKNLLKVSENTMKNYTKVIGEFVVPKLKSEASEKNKAPRISSCRDSRNFDFGSVLGTDEPTFQVNAKMRSFLVEWKVCSHQNKVESKFQSHGTGIPCLV